MPVVLRDGVAVHVAVGVHDLQAVVPRVGDAVHADLARKKRGKQSFSPKNQCRLQGYSYGQIHGLG